MRWVSLLRLSCAAILVHNGVSTPTGFALQRRQDTTDNAAPTLTSEGGSAPTTSAPGSTQTDDSTDQGSISTSAEPSDQSSAEPSSEPTSSSNSTSTQIPSSTRSVSAPSSAATNGTVVNDKQDNQLPLKPRITPALSIGGVILILTGIAYSLVGVKNRWVQVSLSSAYLASLAVTVLIDYVMKPPISDGVQGAYFVGIFMTGVIFGGGALIFKEVTEGLGCLLGGFCLSMWFLVLKPGGLIMDAAGKGIFIAIFCVIIWALSFSHYTRAYAMIGSTSFSGATAFVLGVDCFSKAGLKEFWFYIWGLNNNLFPLGTTTFPQTRGIRVEIIIIILGTIIGVISQIKLWRIVKDKQKKKEEARLDDERRKDVVEQALGRQLERQNDRDRSNWEKQYGNKLGSKRSTVLWTDAHPDKSYTHIPNLDKRMSSSSESLEMGTYGGRRQSRLKRQTSALVESIKEEREDPDIHSSMEREKALTALEDPSSEANGAPVETATPENAGPEIIPLPFKIPTAHESARSNNGTTKPGSPALLQEPKRASKRSSLQSMLSRSPRLSTERLPFSESQEALVLPGPIHSRGSSIAATLDEENDLAELHKISDEESDEPANPRIVVSDAACLNDLHKNSVESIPYDAADAPPSPPALSVCSDFDDPEALARPVDPARSASTQGATSGAQAKDKRLSSHTKASTASESGPKQSTDSYDNSDISTGQTTASEGFTKGHLDNLPSQLSNVVMSYRTNEWAKHISTADAPVFDEPETIEGTEDDAPIQLAPHSPAVASPTSEQSLENSKTLTTASKPPAPHVITSSPGGNVVANLPPLPQRSLSAQTVSQVQPSVAPARPAQPMRASTSKVRRTSWGKPSLVSTPIDENIPTEFAPVRAPTARQSMAMPKRVASSSSLAGQSIRPMTAQGGQMYALGRSSSYASVDDVRMSRSSSFMGNPVMGNAQAFRSDTRLSGYDSPQPQRSSSAATPAPLIRSATRLSSYESHQPSQRAYTTEAQKREQLLAEWRMSQQQTAAVNVVPQQVVDTRRAQMLQDKEHKRMMEDQHRVIQQQQQIQIDQVMRRPDMQELHREAMRKMQAGASKKL